MDPLTQNFTSDFEIKINMDTIGHVAWRLNVAHPAGENNDADCKSLIKVIKRLTEFASELETISELAE